MELPKLSIRYTICCLCITVAFFATVHAQPKGLRDFRARNFVEIVRGDTLPGFGPIIIWQLDTVGLKNGPIKNYVDSLNITAGGGRTYLKDAGGATPGVLDSTGALYTLNYASHETMFIQGAVGFSNQADDSVQFTFGNVTGLYIPGPVRRFHRMFLSTNTGGGTGWVRSLPYHPCSACLGIDDSTLFSVRLRRKSSNGTYWLSIHKFQKNSGVAAPLTGSGGNVVQDSLPVSLQLFPAIGSSVQVRIGLIIHNDR